MELQEDLLLQRSYLYLEEIGCQVGEVRRPALMLAGGPEVQWAPSGTKLECPLEATRLQEPERPDHACAATAAGGRGPEEGEGVEHVERVEPEAGEHETEEPEEEHVTPEEPAEPEGPENRVEQLGHVVEPAESQEGRATLLLGAVVVVGHV